MNETKPFIIPFPLMEQLARQTPVFWEIWEYIFGFAFHLDLIKERKRVLHEELSKAHAFHWGESLSKYSFWFTFRYLAQYKILQCPRGPDCITTLVDSHFTSRNTCANCGKTWATGHVINQHVFDLPSHEGHTGRCGCGYLFRPSSALVDSTSS